VSEDGSDPEELFHPAFVACALEWAERLTPEELLNAARIDRRGESGYLPEAALVRLVRRHRVEGSEELSNRLSLPLIERAYAYAMRICARFGGEKDELAHEALITFLEDLKQLDSIDWWEITFHAELKKRVKDAYRRLFKRHRQRSIEFGDEHERSDGGGLARRLARDASLAAIAEKYLKTTERRRLFMLIMAGDLPIDAPEAPNDLVRLTGKAKSTLAGLKSQFTRIIQDALAEKGL
jgi:hypothetical protein